MLSYEEALARILESVGGPLRAETVPLASASGRVLAEDIIADSSLPPFDNSAVDGYAIASPAGDNRGDNRRYPLREGDIPAGMAPPPLLPGQAARIFTGAMVPEGADRVMMQEDAHLEEGTVSFASAGRPGQFIRRRGSDVPAGTRVLEAGQILEPGRIGLLAALNQAAVPCVRLPTVGLLTTGDELVPVGGNRLEPGQIRDSNGPALAAAVASAGGVVVQQGHARDTPEAVHRALDTLTGCDLVIASGGVSVGSYDVVRSVLEARGRLAFWRVAIKPGKPLAFGQLGSSLFFGLPGNPVSSLVTFELFVRPVLCRLGGRREIMRRRVSAVLTEDLPHEPGRLEFVRAALTWAEDTYYATPTGAQGSHRLASLLGADTLLLAAAERGDYARGERLPALLLPA